MNDVNLFGNVGSVVFDNDAKEEKAMIILSVATNERWINKAGQEESKTIWHKVNLYGKQADYWRSKIQVGGFVWVKGSLQYSEYKDKNEVERVQSYVKASRLMFNGK